MTPPLSIYAMYQADLFDMQNNRPRWYGHFIKYSRNFTFKLRVYTLGKSLTLTELQGVMSMDNVLKHFWQVQDDMRQRKVLSFILMRSLLRLQYFFKAIKRMRTEAAFKIQRTRRTQKMIKDYN